MSPSPRGNPRPHAQTRQTPSPRGRSAVVPRLGVPRSRKGAGRRTGLTARQLEVFEFLKRSVAERGFPPTMAEIAHHFGMRSQNAAAQHLRLIAQKGFITIERGRSRGICIINNHSAASGKDPSADSPTRGRFAIPVVGRVAAGSPILAEENHDGVFIIDRDAFTRRIDYLLRVAGDSMIGAGIQSGDLVAVHRTPEARDGEIAVVRVGGDSAGEVTVKRIRRRGDLLTLVPENPRMRPVEISLREESVAIEGVVVGLIRTQFEAK